MFVCLPKLLARVARRMLAGMRGAAPALQQPPAVASRAAAAEATLRPAQQSLQVSSDWPVVHTPTTKTVQVAALRVLAILGENELVERAAGRPPIQGRGVRVLSLGARCFWQAQSCTPMSCCCFPHPLPLPAAREASHHAPNSWPACRRRGHEGHGHGAPAARAGAPHRQAHLGAVRPHR